jgi:hypothetical protein
MVRKNPAMHMTTNFRGTDNKKYLHCSLCGYSELDPDAEQPQETVNPQVHLDLAEKHALLDAAHEKLKADNAALAQENASIKAELAKANAKLTAIPAQPSGVVPGAAPFNPPAADVPQASAPLLQSAVSAYPKVLHDPSLPQKPDVEVRDAVEEEKYRAEGYTIVIPSLPMPAELPPAHFSGPGWEKPA